MLECYYHFASEWVMEVKIKLLLKYLLKLSWLLDGSLCKYGSFYCWILIRCVVFIASAKIRDSKRSILPSSFYAWTLAQPLVTSVSLLYQADDLQFLFPLFLLFRPTRWAGWHSLVFVECTTDTEWMGKQMEVGFCWGLMLLCTFGMDCESTCTV